MNQSEVVAKLNELLSLPAETEIVEFKEAKNSFDIEKLGKYFSAISNEANLRGFREGWLVFGVNDQKQVVGTNFRHERAHLDKLKSEIANKTTNATSFIEIYDLLLPTGRVVMFQIPAAPRGLPIAYSGFCYAREGDAQTPLSLEKQDRIRHQPAFDDWSAVVCPSATLDDLDPKAVYKARQNFTRKNPHLAEEIGNWDDLTFLNKSKLALQGKITRATILLLGKSEASHFIHPSIAQITWILKDRDGVERSYEHFSCPFLLAIDYVFSKIRNLRYQYMPNAQTIIPDEVDQYEPFNIREALNNCIAHQDYTLNGRIQVVEREDGYLIFTNPGSFLPGSIEQVIQNDAPFEKYRNTFLAQAMVNLQMIDTIGSGIRRMFINQRKRFFPMPDYDFEGGRVKVTLTGKILDLDYAQVLGRNTDLSLFEIIMLDKLQKNQSLTPDAIRHLRKKGLVEGSRNHLHISRHIAASTGQEVEYALAKGLDDYYLKQMIVQYIESFGPATRGNIDRLLLDKLPNTFSVEQKQIKIKNLLASLRRDNFIRIDKGKRWVLSYAS
ncbi:RNA-binding domain-containing protein [Fibrella sp. WM1]|uniref:RNA-binding domain-containing protein n=1 Tax=Fibrella musci TaxID=3242485 RepID=UPI003520738D